MTKNHLTIIAVLLSVVVLAKTNSCSSQAAKQAPEATAIASNEFFKPGIGFFMGRLLTFHEKLWHSLQAENGDLANFYIHELEETMEDLEDIHAGSKEAQLIQMLTPPIEAIEDALDSTDFVAAKDAFLLLTSSCNSCHATLDYDYIEITIPTENTFSNQDFAKK